MATRFATLTVADDAAPSDVLRAVRRFLPSNYSADLWRARRNVILIHGEDSAGWTLDGYVIPRLASGLYFARERDGSESIHAV